ncbi:MAG: hypothetical protein KIT57_12030 [Blastocatellales bacterium]|nr:hypothetical protein [Blastocatellales bacterium]
MRPATVPALLLASSLIISTITMPESPVAAQNPDDALRSRAEITDYEETTRYEEVRAFLAALKKRSRALHLESFGATEEGREMPLMVMADPPARTPREARASGKPIVFIQANIHAGEVEGKEAMLHFSRRLLLGDLQPLLKKLVIMIAPIYNADGNERISTDNRAAQYGPVGGVGTRENAKGLDLNRDYMKLESAETRALVGLFNRWDPHLIVDLHTTNGSYHGYHLTYAPTLNPTADARLIDYARGKMLPAIQTAMNQRHSFRTYYYGNFATREALGREVNSFREPREGEAQTRVWRTFDHRPRFGNNYAGMRNRLTILSEAYSYVDFRRRVEVTEAFVEEICRFAAAHGREIPALIARVDRDAARSTPMEGGVEYELQALPEPVDILVGAVRRVKNPRSGKEMVAMIEETATPARMPDYGLFAAKRSVPLPKAYVFRNEEGLKTIAERLRAHGVPFERLKSAQELEVESFTIERVTRAGRVFQGHQEVRLAGARRMERMKFPAGSILVPMNHAKRALAFYLLEAESDDGFVNWNFLDDYLEKDAVYPIYRIVR